MQPCFDKPLEELEDLGPDPGKGDERQEGRKHHGA